MVESSKAATDSEQPDPVKLGEAANDKESAESEKVEPAKDEKASNGHTSASETQEPSKNGEADIVPSNSNTACVRFPSTPPFNWQVVRKRLEHGRYVLDRTLAQDHWKKNEPKSTLLHPKGVHWDMFRNDVLGMCHAAIERDPAGAEGGSGTLGYAATKIKDVSDENAAIVYCIVCSHVYSRLYRLSVLDYLYRLSNKCTSERERDKCRK